jgi:hypothetical protein
MKLLIKEIYFKEEPNNDEIIEPEEESLDPEEEELLASLERETEREINLTAELEEVIHFDENNPLEEKMNLPGHNYENQVIKALKKARIAGNIKSGGGSSALAADADMNIYGDIFNIEVKLNPRAQMGGSSVRYSKGGEISLAKPLEPDTDALLIDAVKAKKKDLNNLLSFLSGHAPAKVNKNATKFPIAVTREAWNDAQKADLLVNTMVPLTANFIAKHYANKDIYYIQIGNAGLFYMAKNPAKLPVPKLKGKVTVEVRTGSKGTKNKLKDGTEIVGGGIRAQGRLTTENQSPYTLDDPDSIKAMLKDVKNKKKKK